MNHPSKQCWRRTWMIAAVAAGLASPLVAAGDPAESWDRFRLLAERNIFLRDRRPPRPPRVGPPRPVADDRDRRLVLTGTALCGTEFVAFFEDVRSGETFRARAGATVGTGRLHAITLDGVEYETGGKTTSVEIGFSLAGEAASLPTRRTTVTAEPDLSPTEAETPPQLRPETNGQEPPKPEATAPADGTSTAEQKETTPPDDAGDADLADILQRMRRRREEELKK